MASLAFVITYGRMSEDVLRGKTITKSVKTLDTLPEEQSQQKFWVRFGGNVMWTLPVKDCQTWFVGAMLEQDQLWPHFLAR